MSRMLQNKLKRFQRLPRSAGGSEQNGRDTKDPSFRMPPAAHISGIVGESIRAVKTMDARKFVDQWLKINITRKKLDEAPCPRRARCTEIRPRVMHSSLPTAGPRGHR